MTDFTWNGGGEWQQRLWTQDLPTDSAVLFYLFSAFLQTPRFIRPCLDHPDTFASSNRSCGFQQLVTQIVCSGYCTRDPIRGMW